MTKSTPDSSAPGRIDIFRNRCAAIRVRFRTALREEFDQGLGILPVLLLFVAIIPLVPVAAFGHFVISRHAEGYIAAGVEPSDAYSGAVVGQVLVAAVLAILAWLVRRGTSSRSLLICGGAATALALAFALLPNVVAGNGWLTVVLAVLTTLTFDALLAVVVAILVLLVIGRNP